MVVVIVRCEKPVDNYYYENISSERCGGGIVDGEEKQYYSYVAYITDEVSIIAESCRIVTKVLIISRRDGKVKCNDFDDKSKCEYPEEVHSEYVNGIELRWRPLLCGQHQQERERKLICILDDIELTCIQILSTHTSTKF
jgi:hypothetical protein